MTNNKLFNSNHCKGMTIDQDTSFKGQEYKMVITCMPEMWTPLFNQIVSYLLVGKGSGSFVSIGTSLVRVVKEYNVVFNFPFLNIPQIHLSMFFITNTFLMCIHPEQNVL